MKPNGTLLDYLKYHDEEELEKGFNLFTDSREDIVIIEKKRKQYLVDVPSQSGSGSYEVKLNMLKHDVDDKCDCKAYDRFGQCKHCIAAALYLLAEEFNFNVELEALLHEDDLYDDYLDEEEMGEEEMDEVKPEKAERSKAVTAVPENVNQWKSFQLRDNLKNTTNGLSGEYWIHYNQAAKVSLTGFDEDILHWTFVFKEKKTAFFPEFKYDKKKTLGYRCTCTSATRYPMCLHVRVAFEKLLIDKGINYFEGFRDWTTEKNILLQPYGLTVADEDAKAFQFTVSYFGALQMTAPASFVRSNDKDKLKQLYHSIKARETGGVALVPRPRPMPGTLINFETGFVFNNNSQRMQIGFELEPAKVYRSKARIDVKKLSINQPANLPLLNELDNEMYSLLLHLSDSALLDYLAQQGLSHLKNYASPWQQMTAQSLGLLKKHYIGFLQKLWPQLAVNGYPTFLLKAGKFSSPNCLPASFAKEPAELSFVVSVAEKFITVQLLPVIEGKASAENFELLHGFLFYLNGALYIIKNEEDLPVLAQFQNGFIKIATSAKSDVMQNIVAPLQERYPVQLPESFSIKTLRMQPQPQLLLKEFSELYLMLQPQFVYDDVTVDYSHHPEDIVTTSPGGEMQIIQRAAAFEKEFFETFRSLHHTFGQQRQNDFFYVHFNEVMKGNWFLNTVRSLQETSIAVKGIQELRRFRYNTNTPKWEMKAGSGIDWFDLQITVSFGDEEVPLKEVRKAVLTKQNIVLLGDGSFGVLPEEWLQQYGMLLKMGEEKEDGSLQVSKMHFTLIDELHKEIDNVAILEEIAAKKQKLKDIDNIQTAAISKKIKAKLRPYQLSGFQWMQVLEDLGWGGCLADDMGLGKTLQSISFLQHLKEKYKQSTHLVVCPTSLIYNWETELQKFAPSLRYHIYYGSSRSFTDEHFEAYDLVITSYGLVRNDMEQLLRFPWHYVILDESQAIKNPDAQTTKAVQLLRAKNRLILSGTPVQNNTFDLFAQFNFLNPGLLGNKEFFKTEFANPIDKHNDADKSSSLRKLVYPFLLRRTKEQVAKDLPDKTETVLWCQMGKEQRTVYEDYKHYYRAMLLQKIEEEGMAKAGMYVLEGLLRLRQICNSPQLLNDAEVTTTQSVKTEELLREIEENTGSHKLLVFSQFTSMLGLIEKELKQKEIAYCYLDGSTPAQKRKEQVEAFQNNNDIKLFLISLKAGGLGLNLTAADYVYLVDPWWNPAVEQQAIDRTHRIGQTKKIFAYKMICKETVEEKIIQLQQRKKQLANELVTEDAGFIKKLTKDDVQFLFS